MNTYDVKKLLNANPELRDRLYAMGFLFTNDKIDDTAYPFYSLWRRENILGFSLLVSKRQKVFIYVQNQRAIILVGHAYNPFTMEFDENVIIRELFSAGDFFYSKLNELTGIFTLIQVNNTKVRIVGDASCMQTCFYTLHDKKIYISSHTNLIGGLLDFKWDDYVKKLVSYKFFKLFGNSLPGDITQFSSVKRLVPNHSIIINENKIKIHRFYIPHKIDKSTAEIVNKVSELMHNNLELIINKWKKPAISMTGGCDSKTTLACAFGLYDKFKYFSYISSDSEKVDALAARKICHSLGVEHKIYTIPQEDEELSEILQTSSLLKWNCGNICNSNPNDVRKRRYFCDISDFDVEVKSWASEIGRAYYSKRFNGRINFGKMPTPRKCTTLYKFFLHDRRLVKATDKIFENYLKKYFELDEQSPIEWQDQFFWEFRIPSWNGLVITGEHRYSFDITIPYNNRRILELLLSADINDRVNDVIYKAIRIKMNPEIDKTGIAVTNLKHTKNREKAENIYYILHCNIPF